MTTRDRRSYLRLVHQILRLLVRECRLRRQLQVIEYNHEGMMTPNPDGARLRNQVRQIDDTLQQIARNHADLVDVLRERVHMRDCLHRPAWGNAGYYRHFRLRELLRENKAEIEQIINTG